MGYPPIVAVANHNTMDGNEQTLITIASDNIQHFQIKLYYTELVGATEIVKLRLYDTRVQDYDTNPTEALAEIATVDGTAQTVPATIIKVVRWYISSKKIRVTAQQTGGTLGQRDIWVEVHKI
jgi:hypothetical protein